MQPAGFAFVFSFWCSIESLYIFKVCFMYQYMQFLFYSFQILRERETETETETERK